MYNVHVYQPKSLLCTKVGQSDMYNISCGNFILHPLNCCADQIVLYAAWPYLAYLVQLCFFTTKTQSIQSQGMMHGSVLHSNLTSVLTNFKVFDLIYVIICFITILNTILFFTPLPCSIGGNVMKRLQP